MPAHLVLLGNKLRQASTGVLLQPGVSHALHQLAQPGDTTDALQHDAASHLRAEFEVRGQRTLPHRLPEVGLVTLQCLSHQQFRGLPGDHARVLRGHHRNSSRTTSHFAQLQRGLADQLGTLLLGKLLQSLLGKLLENLHHRLATYRDGTTRCGNLHHEGRNLKDDLRTLLPRSKALVPINVREVLPNALGIVSPVDSGVMSDYRLVGPVKIHRRDSPPNKREPRFATMLSLLPRILLTIECELVLLKLQPELALACNVPLPLVDTRPYFTPRSDPWSHGLRGLIRPVHHAWRYGFWRCLCKHLGAERVLYRLCRELLRSLPGFEILVYFIPQRHSG